MSEEDIGLPTSLTDIGQMSGSFSDAMCSGVTGLKTDILFSPSGGFSMSGNHYLKNNNKKENTMTRIQRIHTFLEDYKSPDPYLKDLIKPIHQDYQKGLIQEYQKTEDTRIPMRV